MILFLLLTPSVNYDWPADPPPAVVREFENPAVPWGTGHRGVDLAVTVGAPVRAAADGQVAFAGVVVTRGVVSVLHDDGVRTTYEPLDPAVTAGDLVGQGDVLGYLVEGHDANALHWGARSGQEYLDPLSLLAGTPVRLLPLQAETGEEISHDRSGVGSPGSAVLDHDRNRQIGAVGNHPGMRRV